MLSQRLARSPYLGGRSPTSVDALALAYLAPVLRAPLPDRTWKTKVETYAEVCSFVNRLLQTYFPGLEAPRPKQSGSGASGSDEEEPSFAKWNLFSVAVAAAAMSGYVYATGLFS